MTNEPSRPPLTPPAGSDSLGELWRRYQDADEIVFQRHCGLDEQEIADLCRRARRLAHSLRLHYGARGAAEIAGIYGVEVRRRSWHVAEGQVLYLAESTLRPPQLRLNVAVIRLLADGVQACLAGEAKTWFTEAQIAEVATAHELYHILEQRPSHPSAELAAHAFVREFAGLPFSPLLYSVLLGRLAKGERRARLN